MAGLSRQLRSLQRAGTCSPGRGFHCSAAVHSERKVRVGCSSGFWGDTPTAVTQLVQQGELDYLVADYLSEITMSLLVAARAKNPQLGFCPDFVEAVAPHLADIKRRGLRVVTNGGGINPAACAAALAAIAKKSGTEMKIACVTGDDLMAEKAKLVGTAKEMFTGAPLPATVNSMNAYYGAGPIVRALEAGAEIVVTGRATDSALALGPLMHEHGWGIEDWDKLAAGSLAGHLIECGAQATGGNHSDWEQVGSFANMGFPIAEVSESGELLLTKPPGTGGIISVGTVAEQMLYEIGDPRAYQLPDVVADWSNVQMLEVAGGVRVKGARGRPPSNHYKISATYMDGYKATCVAVFQGGAAARKARAISDSILERSRTVFASHGLQDFPQTHVQVLGAEDSFGAAAVAESGLPREAVLWQAVQHQDKRAIQLWAREIAACGTGGVPGTCAVVGGRPKPSPCLKLFSFLHPKSEMDAVVSVDGEELQYQAPVPTQQQQEVEQTDEADDDASLPVGPHSARLDLLAYTRSGDKGDSCNIGVIARDPAFLPYIRRQLTEQAVAQHFAHVFDGPAVVRRFSLPGTHALNFLLEASLGGGGIASLRPDPQGKAYGQILADLVITGLPDLEELKSTI